MIYLKYPSRCNSCNQYMTAGTQAYWRKGCKGVRCKTCAEDRSTFTIRYEGPVPAETVRKALATSQPKGRFSRNP